jgi:transposase
VKIIQLTYKIPHHLDFSKELQETYNIVNDALITGNSDHKKYKDFTSMGTAIIQGLIRKYKGVNKKVMTKTISNAVIPVRGQAIRQEGNRFKIMAKIDRWFTLPSFVKIDKIDYLEITKTTINLTTSVNEKPERIAKHSICIDLNSTGHIAVLGNSHNGEVIKYNKDAPFIRFKYRRLRKKIQADGKFRHLKKMSGKKKE